MGHGGWRCRDGFGFVSSDRGGAPLPAHAVPGEPRGAADPPPTAPRQKLPGGNSLRQGYPRGGSTPAASCLPASILSFPAPGPPQRFKNAPLGEGEEEGWGGGRSRVGGQALGSGACSYSGRRNLGPRGSLTKALVFPLRSTLPRREKESGSLTEIHTGIRRFVGFPPRQHNPRPISPHLGQLLFGGSTIIFIVAVLVSTLFLVFLLFAIKFKCKLANTQIPSNNRVQIGRRSQ